MYTLVSLVAAFIVVKIFDTIVAGATGSWVGIVRAGLFVATWTAVTAKMGMRGFSKRLRQLRHRKVGVT